MAGRRLGMLVKSELDTSHGHKTLIIILLTLWSVSCIYTYTNGSVEDVAPVVLMGACGSFGVEVAFRRFRGPHILGAHGHIWALPSFPLFFLRDRLQHKLYILDTSTTANTIHVSLGIENEI